MSRSRGWCFTLNNYTEWDQKALEKVDCRFLIFGKEVAPTTGTPHLQGYIYWDSLKSMKAVKKVVGERAHLQPANGTAEENIKYCSKEGVVFQKGDPPAQGKRKDIEELVCEIQGGATVDDIALSNPMAFHQYGRTLQRVEDILLRKRFRTEMTQGIWLYGSTGVGKSHRCFEGYNPETHYTWKYDGGWQDGYVGQEVVLINEFRGQIPLCDMLMLVDKWPHTIRRRGREPAPFLAKKVIVTSSLHPGEIYLNVGNDKIEQLLRRFDVQHITSRDDQEGALATPQKSEAGDHSPLEAPSGARQEAPSGARQERA